MPAPAPEMEIETRMVDDVLDEFESDEEAVLLAIASEDPELSLDELPDEADAAVLFDAAVFVVESEVEASEESAGPAAKLSVSAVTFEVFDVVEALFTASVLTVWSKPLPAIALWAVVEVSA